MTNIELGLVWPQFMMWSKTVMNQDQNHCRSRALMMHRNFDFDYDRGANQIEAIEASDDKRCVDGLRCNAVDRPLGWLRCLG